MQLSGLEVMHFLLKTTFVLTLVVFYTGYKGIVPNTELCEALISV